MRAGERGEADGAPGAMAPPGGWNMLGYANGAVDAALDAGQRATARAERSRLVAEVQARGGRHVPPLLRRS